MAKRLLSPEELSPDKLRTAVKGLKGYVIGQDGAIEKVNDIFIQAHVGLSGVMRSLRQSKSKGILFLAGPTGIGMTQLAKSLARFPFSDEDALVRIDMPEYKQEHRVECQLGAPPEKKEEEHG